MEYDDDDFDVLVKIGVATVVIRSAWIPAELLSELPESGDDAESDAISAYLSTTDDSIEELEDGDINSNKYYRV